MHGWLDTGCKSTNLTFPHTAPELSHVLVDFSFSQSGPSHKALDINQHLSQIRIEKVSSKHD